MPVCEQPASRRLRSALRREIESHNLRGARLLVAVSGGPDSLALIHALTTLREDLGLDLHAAHLDHALRPGSSEADAAFVREAMVEMAVPLTVERIDVAPFRSSRRTSLEAAARTVRYRFLADVAARIHAAAVAIGHTLDDQAETVLMRILRGAGLSGLRAMSTLSESTVDGGRLRLFRPLLSLPKSDTLAYCTENGLAPRFDESNLSTDLTRNRIRLELLPELEGYNPSVRQALVRLSESASLDYDFIRQHVDAAAHDVLTPVLDKHRYAVVSIERRKFMGLHPAIQGYMVRRAFEMASGRSDDLTFTHVEDMVRLISGPAGRRIDLPDGVILEVDYDQAHLRSGGGSGPCLPQVDPMPRGLDVPGRTASADWTFSARLLEDLGTPAERREPDGLRLSESFDADRMGRDLTVRTRLAGDLFWPLGMDGEKLLKNFMQDAHIPRRWRDIVPVVTAADGRIAWVVGWRIADWAKVTDNTRRVLKISGSYELRG